MALQGQRGALEGGRPPARLIERLRPSREATARRVTSGSSRSQWGQWMLGIGGIPRDWMNAKQEALFGIAFANPDIYPAS